MGMSAGAVPEWRWERPSSDAEHFETGSVAPLARFEFWRSLFPGVDLRLPESEAPAPFWGELTRYFARGGVSFQHARFDPVVARYTDSASSGAFLLALLLRGRVEMSDGDGSTLAATQGLFLIDTSRPVALHGTRCAFGTLRLPRPLILDAVGGNPMPSRGGLLQLPDHGLAPFLSIQLELLSERGPKLPASEREVVLEASVDLALELLRARLRELPSGRALSEDGLFTAAKLYVERHFHRPDLNPEQIARALGCSRPGLYRLFAKRNLAVVEFIRELRLQRSCELLRADPEREINAIALECGYPDASAFNRAFKRRFGLNPTEWRTGE